MQNTDRAVFHELEARAKVCEHYVASAVEQHIVRLDVAVHIAQLMQRMDGQHHLRHVEASHLLRQAVLELGQQRQQVTAAVVIHHQVL